MTYVGYNTTGWTELYNGHMISAAYAMFDQAFAGWTIFLLFAVYQFMLYRKTESLLLGTITGWIFMAMYFATNTLLQNTLPLPQTSFTIIFIVVLIESVIVLYGLIFR